MYIDQSFFKPGQLHVIWKRSQYLHQWKQRQLQFLNCSTIATAKKQTIDGWNPSFQIDVESIKKLTIYHAEYIENHRMIPIKVQYQSSHTYFADKSFVAVNLFHEIIQAKCKVQLISDKLEKTDIKGNDFIQYKQFDIQERMIIYREKGIIGKEWRKQQMLITSKELVCFHEQGFGNEAHKGCWHTTLEAIQRLSTKFQFYKDFLIVNITSKHGNCRFAVPINGKQLIKLFNAVGNSHKLKDQ